MILAMTRLAPHARKQEIAGSNPARAIKKYIPKSILYVFNERFVVHVLFNNITILNIILSSFV